MLPLRIKLLPARNVKIPPLAMTCAAVLDELPKFQSAETVKSPTLDTSTPGAIIAETPSRVLA